IPRIRLCAPQPTHPRAGATTAEIARQAATRVASRRVRDTEYPCTGTICTIWGRRSGWDGWITFFRETFLGTSKDTNETKETTPYPPIHEYVISICIQNRTIPDQMGQLIFFDSLF